ncbi:DUF1330 domain-containing protein [Pseudoalteromonas sp. T1lg23B]|uniref:DUF1330 domain-containing protein n=1 Tax=Pseudoalteromonas sp. T1lg23B TaxID=2077097 RepID=UPI0018FE3793|nr:DUF1330 domain-containing protein [Pseudoalteromonas sp. T1lg23B]
MSALIIVKLKVKDMEKLKEYSAQTGAILEKFDGKVLIKGAPTVLCGDVAGFDKTVVFEFPSREAAEGWYNSPEYQALIAIRDEAMDCTFEIAA